MKQLGMIWHEAVEGRGMKPSLLLCLGLALAPLPVFAQQGPAPGALGTSSFAPSPQMLATMRQSHAQLRQLRRQARAAMLAALTPAQRTLLASLVGQLALSVEPDLRSAATRLDAVLAPAQKQSVLNIDATEHADMRALMQQTRSAVEATMSADQRAQMAQRDARMEAFHTGSRSSARAADPGMIVLRTLGSFASEHGPGGPPAP